MWTMNIYKVFYVVAHAIFTIFETIYGTTNHFYDKLFLKELLPFKGYYLPSDSNIPVKKPKHITVLLGLEEPDIKDLAKLIFWCITTQISFISFYDYKGNLKKHEQDLQYEVSLYRHKDHHIVWHSNPKTVHKNGFVGKTTHVKILTDFEGKGSVVNLTKQIVSSRSKVDISVCSVNETLLKLFEFPDPDMGIVCGKTFRFFNYPPWQIRLTEFFRLETIRGIRFPQFSKLLRKFSKCEQRLGK
nr:dehydrodolichyl diphosphate synthase complex subunit Nus1 [Leptinotarsa decemlineata]